ncbi:DUF2071 domain-containing protein [Amycolatopsis sacchari]|uniref:Uncharacterized conserved protein (COG2071) n=1 Tax=Amycolatopsis sacchari TaxID=115433 RepID=A0A1I3RIK6_9PSEU|nr:DUF2071 domain-containing protein [Amycolatopsis sacchari]SFJ46098.1 Uncharacterized conserved protein (COG2071) [Amycolatopsis sacchari]
MSWFLRRHPVPMRTRFDHSLVLTYAFEPELLAPLLPRALELDTYRAPNGTEHAFVAVALVSLRQLRPAFLPAHAGFRSVMAGYRVLAKLRTPTGKTLRGLRILRSDTDRRALALGANVLTGYHYHHSPAGVSFDGNRLCFKVVSRDGTADVAVTADLAEESPSWGGVFATPADARRFAGPLPYTFSPEDKGIVVVKAYRQNWQPAPVAVTSAEVSFLRHGPFAGVQPQLANAFHVSDVDYGWHRGELR